MRFINRVLAVVILLSVIPAAVRAQKQELVVNESLSAKVVIPGQMVDIYLEGGSQGFPLPIPSDQFEVLVVQNGATHRAKIRAVAPVMLNVQAPPGSLPSSSDKIPSVSEQLASLKPYRSILFTVPPELVEGDATATLIYRGRRSNEIKFRVVGQPPTPRVMATIKTATLTPSSRVQLPDAIKASALPGFVFERGRDAELNVRPLIDPDVPDSAILVTFKQGAWSRQVTARMVRHEAVEGDGSGVTFAPPRYEVVVKTPEELAVGPAEIEVRLKINSQTSEPALVKATITDSSTAEPGPELVRPHIINLGRSKVGLGQSFKISVDSSQKLGPDPSKTIVVLEQGTRRVELKPEINSATIIGQRGQFSPAFLTVRVGREITGDVTAKVYNPARGEDAGMSNGVPLEIVDEVLPPEISNVTMAGRHELAILRAMLEQALRAGRDFKDYNPSSRYVTIHGTGMDYNPNYVHIQFEQGGRTYTLKFDDFSLSVDDRLVVRLPDKITAGAVKVSIQNRGAGRLSEAVIRIFEVTQASDK